MIELHTDEDIRKMAKLARSFHGRVFRAGTFIIGYNHKQKGLGVAEVVPKRGETWDVWIAGHTVLTFIDKGENKERMSILLRCIPAPGQTEFPEEVTVDGEVQVLPDDCWNLQGPILHLELEEVEEKHVSQGTFTDWGTEISTGKIRRVKKTMETFDKSYQPLGHEILQWAAPADYWRAPDDPGLCHGR